VAVASAGPYGAIQIPLLLIIMDNIIFARNGPMREEYLCNTGTASQPESAARPKTAAEAASCKPVML